MSERAADPLRHEKEIQNMKIESLREVKANLSTLVKNLPSAHDQEPARRTLLISP
jgi:hypothetical protein